MAISYLRNSTCCPQEPNLTEWELGRAFRVCLYLDVYLLFPPSVCLRGFCYFNSVAIAAKQLQHKLSVSKVLIVDWVGRFCWLCSPAGVLLCLPIVNVYTHNQYYSLLHNLLLGRPSWQRHPGSLLQRPKRPLHLVASLRRWQLLPWQRVACWGEWSCLLCYRTVRDNQIFFSFFCDSPLLICDCVFGFRLAPEQERASMST